MQLAETLDVPDGDVVMLENVRYEKGETKNDPSWQRYAAARRRLRQRRLRRRAPRARVHRGRRAAAPSAAGRLLEREVSTLRGILDDLKRPLVAVVGGAR